MHALLVANPSFFCFGRLHSRPALLQSPNASPLLSFRNPQGIRRMRLATKMPARCSMDVALGGSFNYENVPKFPRMNQWDPYKLLGVTPDASGEEIRGARNFLVEQYAGHERSVESIEAAYDKILMKSFRERKKSKINLKSSLKKKVEESPPWVKTLVAYVELPPMDVILRRLFLFIFMAIWSITQSAEAGPAFQVLLSLASCIYFLNDKMKSLPRATISGFATLVIGWIAGSVLVPMIPSSLVQPSWTLELLISLVCYIFFFLSCTFLK